MANLTKFLPIKLFPVLAASLGLESRKSFMDGKLSAYGRREGFPILVQLANPQKKGVVTVAARFRPEQAVPKQLSFDPPLDGLLRSGQIGVIFPAPGGTAQLTLPDFAGWAKRGEDALAVDCFLRGLTRAGLSAGDTCHYCNLNRPGRPVFNGVTVGQVCEVCEAEQRQTMGEERRFDPASLARLIPAGALAVVGCALCWALIWVGVDALFRWGHGTLQLPVKLSTLIAGGLGAAAALPTGLMAGIRHRGYWLAGLMGLAGALAGALLGELLLNFERLWQAGAGIAALSEATRLTQREAAGGSGLFLFLRGTCLVAMLTTAFFIVKPSKPVLKL